ncbi:MAG: hypothetical protein H7Y03_15375 [Chitinophagaceae bacterium]|nr:hypothetical protein [Chitinophagaceae bacterium]
MTLLEKVDSKQKLEKFIDFPHDLYEDDPNYVPEIFIGQRDLLTPGKHPFHEHSQIQLFTVHANGVMKGRIAAILNNNHNTFNKATDGFFGFFDCVDDQSIAHSLFAAASGWLKEKGATTLIGPVNPSTNETCGLLVEGFDKPPVVLMPFCKSYYARLIEKEGFEKKMDLLAYDIRVNTLNDRTVKLQDALLKRLESKNIVLRSINMKDFAGEVKKIKEIYNAAWDANSGFVPFTDAEFNYLAKDLKLILDPGFCFIAEHEGKPVGFALALPDINQVQAKVKRGRLFPFGIFKLLLGKKKINYMRVPTLGVIDGYRKMGIEACFYASIIKRCVDKKMIGGEASWILEQNTLMNKAIENIKGVVHKRYRIFQKQL